MGIVWYGRIVARDKKPNPPVHPIDVAGKIKTTILALIGGKDRGIPVETVRRMEAKIKAAGNNDFKVIICPEAPHAFHADYQPSYR